MAHLTSTRSASTASLAYRALQQWFGWLVREEEIDRSPMERRRPPQVPETPVPVLSEDQLRRLLRSCDGRDFVSRRDTAIIRLFIDTGGRRGEVGRLAVDDVDLVDDVVHVLGKGRRPRALPFGQQTGLALGRYLRVRSGDRFASRPELWLAEKNRGPLLDNGIEQVLKRRGAAVGIPGLHAHMFRHTATHRWRVEGGGDTSPATVHPGTTSATAHPLATAQPTPATVGHERKPRSQYRRLPAG